MDVGVVMVELRKRMMAARVEALEIQCRFSGIAARAPLLPFTLSLK